MKIAVLVAVVAVVAASAGVATARVEQVQAFLVKHFRPLVEVHAAAFVAYFLVRMLKVMKMMKNSMKWIADKCTYIEQRIDAAAAKSGDVCRHMQQVFLEFDEAANHGLTVEVKWWWVERRLRQLYEDFSNSKAMEKCSYEVVKKTWSMLQLECKMRTLRDVVSYRHFEAELLENDEDMDWALKNMVKAAKYCTFWRPMQISELEQHEVQSCFEELLISQIGERVKEVKQYLEGDDMKKYEGLQLEGFVAGSSR